MKTSSTMDLQHLDGFVDATDDEQSVASAAGEAAFADTFEDLTGDSALHGQEPNDDAAAVIAAPPPPEPAPAVAAPPPPPADPFAGLPAEVRDTLAKVPSLEHENKGLNGRLSALQRQFNELRDRPSAPATPAAPAAPAESRMIDKVRAELPEVAQAIEEAIRASAPPPPAAPAPSQRTTTSTSEELSPEDQALADVHPDWATTLTGTDLSLWMQTKPNGFADKVRSSTNTAYIASVLTEFKLERAALTAAQRDAQATERSRQNRVDGATAPAKGNARAPAAPTIEDPEAAFVAGFNGG